LEVLPAAARAHEKSGCSGQGGDNVTYHGCFLEKDDWDGEIAYRKNAE